MLNEKKVFKDNVLGYIEIEEKLIWDLIDTKEFQRLKRIKHLGGVSMVFHCAEHSRFTHSLGVYEITRRMLKSVEGLNLSEYEQMLALSSALLHDLGHGPLSHAFESISTIDHEDMTIRIISEDSEVNQVLCKYDKNIVSDIVKVISHTYENPLVSSVISSQIDADRLDYLVRDSYNSGVVYGITDIERLFRISKVVDNKICFKASALKEIEIYFLSRLCMYEQIYFHPNGRSYELLFQNTLLRYNDLKASGYTFKNNYMFLDNINNKQISLNDFHVLDDTTIIHYMKCFINEDDQVLSDLSSRFINRGLFKFISYHEEGAIAPLTEDIRAFIEELGLDSKYYIVTDTMRTNFYRFDETIYISEEDDIKKLEDVSDIITKLESEKNVTYIYYPHEIEEKVKLFLTDNKYNVSR